MNIPKRIFVTGTDTGVGKTVLSLLIMQLLHEEGRNPFYIKPVQTGCLDPYDADSDARFIYRHVAALKGKDPRESVVYCFRNPKAPWFAARDEGADISSRTIMELIVRRAGSHSPLVIEGAGGLLVPINREVLTVDIIESLGAAPIVAARAGLGTINHTLLSLEALAARSIEPLGVVLIDSGDAVTTRQMIAENIEALETFSGVKVAGLIGKIDDFTAPPAGCYQPLHKLFDSA
jgi:dethiobiotin synthetase